MKGEKSNERVRDRMHSNGRTGDFLSHLTTISLRPPCSRKHDITPLQEDCQTQFYQEYRKVAEEYDKDFLKKYEEDLNTTLIFVSLSGFSRTLVDKRIRLDSFPLSLLRLLSKSTLSSNPIRTTRPPLCCASSFTRSTTLRSATTFPPSHSGPGPHI